MHLQYQLRDAVGEGRQEVRHLLVQIVQPEEIERRQVCRVLQTPQPAPDALQTACTRIQTSSHTLFPSAHIFDANQDPRSCAACLVDVSICNAICDEHVVLTNQGAAGVGALTRQTV